MAEAPQTYQEALDALAKVADSNGNRFRLKVVRRPNAASSVSQHVATFGDATWQHIADAESWLGPFCGGGLYILQIFDGADGRKQYGTIIPSEITGPPRQPNPAVCRSASWLGPVLLSSSADTNGTGAVATGSQLSGLVGEPFPPGAAPRTQADVVGLSNLFSAEKADLARREEDLREKERRAEVDAIRREAEARAKALEAKVGDLTVLLTRPPPTPPPPTPFDVAGLITAVAAVATPIVTLLGNAAADARKAQADLERSRLDREEKAREREALDRAEAAKRPLIDPQILEIMDRQAKRAEEQAAQFSGFLKAQAESARSNAESQAVAQRTMLQTIADVAQLQLKVGQGAEEPPGIDWGKVIQGVAAGLGAFAQAKAGGQVGGPPPPGVPPAGGLPGMPGGPPGLGAQPPPVPEVPLPDVPGALVFDALEDKIREKAPPDQIVADLKKAIEDPAAQAEIEAEGGIPQVFEARLSDFSEDPANAKYMAALGEALAGSGIFTTEE